FLRSMGAVMIFMAPVVVLTMFEGPRVVALLFNAKWQATVAPIVTCLTIAAMQQLNPRLRLQLLALGASRWQLLWLLMREARLPLLAAVMAGFGGVISEVGASMMVGGNLQGQTRVLTTATVLETGKGNFDLAIALSVILLLLAFSVNYLLTWIQQRGRTP
ncbi:MAG: ABC transporter permease, partial [candidate division NC10 bacterium]